MMKNDTTKNATAIKRRKPKNHSLIVRAPMPIECPQCRSSETTAANGVHYLRKTLKRVENRICKDCGCRFTAMRNMTATETLKYFG